MSANLKLNIALAFSIWKKHVKSSAKYKGDDNQTLIAAITRAFTLAEVLITLAVIGVIAAISIPGLVNRTNNAELNAAAKKAFATVSQTYKLAVNDNGGGFGAYAVNTTLTYTKINALKSKLNVVKECLFGSGAYGKCWATNGVGSAITTLSCGQWGLDSQNANYSLVTADGMYIMVYTYSVTNGADEIAIDVNGSKGPNDWGKDVFRFKINDAFIAPYAHNCNGDLKHNDGSVVQLNEFLNPFL